MFLKSNNHPRAYGNFARVLAQYVREEKALNLTQAIQKLAALPARALRHGEATGAASGRAVRGRAWTGAGGGGCRASAQEWSWSP